MFDFLKNIFKSDYDRRPDRSRVSMSETREIQRSAFQHRAKQILAKYDAANDGNYLSRHWGNADALSADAANSQKVRLKLIKRARYEFINNSYCMGMILTLANDIIGRGPRLQMLTPDEGFNELFEADWNLWSRTINLAAQLRTMIQAKKRDGEVFAEFITNPRLLNSLPVSLDFAVYEAEQIQKPIYNTIKSPNGYRNLDGVVIDQSGNPVYYQILKSHPGANSTSAGIWDSTKFRKVDAENMIHLFRVDRPGQHRGVPEITPSLPLYAILRNYTLAVLKAAEVGASYAMSLETDGPANDADTDYDGESEGDGAAVTPETMDVFDLEHAMATVMPAGWHLKGFKPEQPATAYAEFKREVLREIARCLGVPFNVAAGDSSDYNYASGRLDHQTYFKSIDVEHQEIEIEGVEPTFQKFAQEWLMTKGVGTALNELNHTWYWDGREHVDPAKEAAADAIRLKNGTLPYADYYAKQGKDWRNQLKQVSVEQQFIRDNGIVIEAPKDTIIEKELDDAGFEE